MSKLSDVSNAAVREILGCFSQGVVVPAINTGGAATIKTTQTPASSFCFTINGQPKLLANLSAQALTALAALQNPITGQDTFYVQPALTTVIYLFVVNAAGTVYTIQGTYLNQTFTPFKNALGDGSMPDIAVKETYAPIGAMKIVLANAATFTPGTTALDATDVTATYASVNRLGNALPTFA